MAKSQNLVPEPEAVMAQEELPEGIVEWQCPFCEKPQIISGADDMVLHVKFEHARKLRDFCISTGLDYDEVMERLGERPSTKKASAPAPVAAEEPVAKAEPATMTCPTCGKVYKSTGYYNAHIKKCGLVVEEPAVEPAEEAQPEAEPLVETPVETEVTMETARAETLAWEPVASVVNGLNSLESNRAKALKAMKADSLRATATWQIGEELKLRIAKEREAADALQPYAATGIPEYVSLYEQQLEAVALAEKALQDITASPLYARGSILEPIVMAEKHALVAKAKQEAAEHNLRVESYNTAEDDAEAWQRAEHARFSQMLDGRLRIPGSRGRINTLISDLNIDVSSNMAGIPLYAEYTICLAAATDGLAKFGFKAIGTKTADITIKHVNADGEIWEEVKTQSASREVPVDAWAELVAKVLLFVRNKWRTANKMGPDEAMSLDEFEAEFGFKLQAQERLQGIALESVRKNKGESKEKDQTPTAMEFALRSAMQVKNADREANAERMRMGKAKGNKDLPAEGRRGKNKKGRRN